MAKQPTPDLATPRDTPAQNHARARETVNVYFKEHISWLDLQLEKPHTVKMSARTVSGSTETQEAMVYYKVGPVVRIRGLSYPVGSVPDGFGDKPLIVAGFAVTHNVDKIWWDEWFETHQDYPPVKGGFLFAHPNRADAAAIAKDHGGVPQFSPIDPKNPADKRVLKSGNPDMSPIKSDESRSPAPLR